MRRFGREVGIMSDKIRVKHISHHQGVKLEEMVNDWLSDNHVEIISIDHVVRSLSDSQNMFYYLIKYILP